MPEESGEPLPELTGLPKRILRRSLTRVRRLRQELESLRSAYAEREDLPGLRTLVDAMGTLAAEAEREILIQSRELYSRLHDGGSAEEAASRFQEQVGGLMNALEEALPSALQIAREPHGREIEALILPFTRLIARLMREEPRSIELIFEPSDDYYYELSVVEELRPLANFFKPELRELLRQLPQLIAIAYPQQLEAETLGHTIIAHEVAHTVLHYVPPGESAAPILEAFDDAVTEHYPKIRDAITRHDESEEDDLDGRSQEVIDRMRKWFEELACDTLAVGMVGPAYVFALADLDLASDRWAQIRGGAGHDSHPGLAWRLRRVITQALTTYLPEDREEAPAWMALRRALAELEADLPSELDQLLEQERALIESALSNLADCGGVEKVLSYARYQPTDFAAGIEIVWNKLHARIPPAELIEQRASPGEPAPELTGIPKTWSKPMDWRSIMNGGYAYWFGGHAISVIPKEHRTFPDHRRITQDWMDFNAYIRGTIELSDLHERLAGVRERLDGLNAPELN